MTFEIDPCETFPGRGPKRPLAEDKDLIGGAVVDKQAGIADLPLCYVSM